MSPAELKQANIERFQRLLAAEADPLIRSRIEKLLAEERLKRRGAYPEELCRPRPT